MRGDGRRDDELRPITFERGVTEHPAGSVMVSYGRTRVLCTATVDESVPRWLLNQGKGWVTAEYGMLPGSTHTRKARADRIGKADSRALEISRFIGRSLRAIIDLRGIRDKTIWLDCDVIQADGGTRTAAISGAYVALHDAISSLNLKKWPLSDSIAAVSVGVVKGQPVLDLDYLEDSRADVDCNIAMTGEGKFVEIQGTAESDPFDDAALQEMLRLARRGIASITAQQQMALEK